MNPEEEEEEEDEGVCIAMRIEKNRKGINKCMRRKNVDESEYKVKLFGL